MVLTDTMDPSQISPQPLTPRQSPAYPYDAENVESVVGPVAFPNSDILLFPADSQNIDDVFLRQKPHAVGDDDEMEGMSGDADESPTMGPYSDSISRSGCIVEGGKTTGMMSEDNEVGNLERTII